MASVGDQLLLRAFIAAAVNKRSKDEVQKLLEDLSVTETLEPGVSANALAYTLGDADKISTGRQHKIEDWLEWEETILRKAVDSKRPEDLLSALEQLTQALSSTGDFLGRQLTVADIAILSTLHPLAASGKLGQVILEYLERIEKAEGVQEGIQNLQEYIQAKQSSSLASGSTQQAKNNEKKSKKSEGNSAQNDANSSATRNESQGISSSEIQPRSDENYSSSPQILPIRGQRNILITSALPYVNNVPHLGNIVGCVLSADCYARFARSRGYNTLYVCGTDEYGTATETKALEEGLTCQEVCDRYHAIHKQVYEWFQISFDKFGRTPTWQQTEICQEIFQRLNEEGCIIEDNVEQLFSEALGKFLADRFVLGTCPKCKYEDAKGDQCDNCGSLLNPIELINPRCKVTNTTPVLRTSKHLFLDLPKLTSQLQEYVEKTSKAGNWSANCVATTKAWMRDGLKQRCITRDLIWGTPVPQEGYENKVFYVWFDAPIGYISITANYTDQWKVWWQNPEEVDLVQFMGKDNVPFHTIIFPSTQIGTGDQWTKMKNISVTEYLNYEGTKFSKSNGVGVFGTDAKDTGIPVEVWRYYLLSNRPEVSDTDFKWTDLRSRLNSELLANLGNFINRALVFTSSKFGGKVPQAVSKNSQVKEASEQLQKEVSDLTGQYIKAMEEIKMRDGISKAMAISSRANKFIQDTKPWVLLKGSPEDVEACGTIIKVALGVVLLLAGLIEPFMPSISSKILSQLRLSKSEANLTDKNIENLTQISDSVPAGHQIGSPEVLFREISEGEIEGLRVRYAGQQKQASGPVAKPKIANGVAKGKEAKKGNTEGGEKKGVTVKKQSEPSSDSQTPARPKEKKAKIPPQKSPVPSDISAVDLRVGVMTNVRRHENADSLYVEDVQCGEEQPRQVVSGLVKHFSNEQLEGKRVVIVANLKAGNMRGVKSHAMVLAASSQDGSKVELVEPPEGSIPGEKVIVEGFNGDPISVLKKEVFDPIAEGLKTNPNSIACYNGVALQTSKGPCKVQTLIGAGIH